MILSCTCKSEYQDSKYGKGNRVYNRTKNGARCTICGKESSIKEDKNVEEIKK